MLDDRALSDTAWPPANPRNFTANRQPQNHKESQRITRNLYDKAEKRTRLRNSFRPTPFQARAEISDWFSLSLTVNTEVIFVAEDDG